MMVKFKQKIGGKREKISRLGISFPQIILLYENYFIISKLNTEIGRLKKRQHKRSPSSEQTTTHVA